MMRKFEDLLVPAGRNVRQAANPHRVVGARAAEFFEQVENQLALAA
jgi:hypothetical protein